MGINRPIVVVIDTGYFNQYRYDARSGISDAQIFVVCSKYAEELAVLVRQQGAAHGFSDIELDCCMEDALTDRLVAQPEFIDVIVAENLLVDIISESGPTTMGSVRLSPAEGVDLTRDQVDVASTSDVTDNLRKAVQG